MSLRVSMDLRLAPSAAFDEFVDELVGGLGRLGLKFNPGREGNVTTGTGEVGRVVGWAPGRKIGLEWLSADWDRKITTKVEVRFEPTEAGTRITLEYHDRNRLLDYGKELAGWFAREIVSQLFLATSPERFGDWLTDRRARRPSGSEALRRVSRPHLSSPQLQGYSERTRSNP